MGRLIFTFASTVSEVSTGTLTLPLDDSYQVGSFEDGSSAIWIAAPSGVTVSDDETHTYDGSTTGEEVNGAQVDPQFYAGAASTVTQGYDGRTNRGLTPEPFNSSLVPSFPVTLSPGDVLVKARSRGASSDNDRSGLLDEVASIFILSSPPAANSFAPATVGWSGRSSLTSYVIDLDAKVTAFKALLPSGGYDTSGFSNGTITYSSVIANIEKFMPLFPQRPLSSPNIAGYEAIGIPYHSAAFNYGQFFGGEISDAFLYAISDQATDAQIKEILRKLISMGIQWLDPFEGANETWGANGGHYQFMFIPCLLALWATNRDFGKIKTYLPGNTLAGPFEIDSAFLAKLVPHDSNDDPYPWRRRTITAVTSNTVTIPDFSGDAAQVAFTGLILTRESDGLERTITDLSFGGGGYVLTYSGGDNAFSVDDVVYCESPYTITTGFDWMIRQGQLTTGDNTYNPLPAANYRALNKFGPSAVAAILFGGGETDFVNLIGYVDRSVAGNDPAGYDFPDTGETDFALDFMDTHWATINA